MRKRSNPPPTTSSSSDQIDGLLGLGAFSARKSYYPALLEKISELETLNAELDERVQRRTWELEQSLQALKDTQGQLIQAEKMASLGQLVAGMAHEINTPVGNTLTAVSLLYDTLEELDSALTNNRMTRSGLQESLAVSLEASSSSLINLKRVAELITSFKQVAVDQTQQVKREFDLAAYLQELVTNLQLQANQAGHQITLRGTSHALIYCDPSVFTQILTSLISNALAHGFPTGTTGHIEIHLHADAQQAELSVTDNGIGMPPEILERIFDPFFTTTRGQGSSGLGLHILYNLVTQGLGGSIDCESQPNHGTRFLIHFPLRAP